mmetsp:Transcript_72703/g.187566  ORF Transcript_72703/g.187566 Transcript_72703/m.187566 type:complete len:289 (-) Transcript_72703:931-1797(-)
MASRTPMSGMGGFLPPPRGSGRVLLAALEARDSGLMGGRTTPPAGDVAAAGCTATESAASDIGDADGGVRRFRPSRCMEATLVRPSVPSAPGGPRASGDLAAPPRPAALMAAHASSPTEPSALICRLCGVVCSDFSGCSFCLAAAKATVTPNGGARMKELGTSTSTAKARSMCLRRSLKIASISSSESSSPTVPGSADAPAASEPSKRIVPVPSRPLVLAPVRKVLSGPSSSSSLNPWLVRSGVGAPLCSAISSWLVSSSYSPSCGMPLFRRIVLSMCFSERTFFIFF